MVHGALKTMGTTRANGYCGGRDGLCSIHLMYTPDALKC